MLADPSLTSSAARFLGHARRSRTELRAAVDLARHFDLWEETCVPSYCHPNVAAAAVSWLRLRKALQLADRLGANGPVLDFGSGSGELGRLLNPETEYHFVEQEEPAAQLLTRRLPMARRHQLADIPLRSFGCVFALDSLEHNHNFEQLLERLSQSLGLDGLLILSGPTENRLYRAGRRIAGFGSHYHKTTVHAIEATASRLLSRSGSAVVVPTRVVPLFRISAWSQVKRTRT